MVQPVHAVADHARPVLLALPLAIRWRHARLNRIYWPWYCGASLTDRVALEGAGRSVGRRTLRAPLPAWLLAAIAARTEENRYRQPGTLAPVESLAWEAWAAFPPFADEVERWWPDNEPLPVTPPLVIEDHQPDQAAMPLVWPAHGGLFDSFA